MTDTAQALHAQNDDQAAAPDPREKYKSPELLMTARDLTNEEKQELLQHWLTDLTARLEAESEGMSASDPIAHHREASLADELSRVNAALTGLAGPSEDVQA